MLSVVVDYPFSIAQNVDVHGQGQAEVSWWSFEGSPVIIDLDHAEEHHCERTMDIDFHTKVPFPEHFKCDELFDACESVGAWTPRSCHLLHQQYS